MKGKTLLPVAGTLAMAALCVGIWRLSVSRSNDSTSGAREPEQLTDDEPSSDSDIVSALRDHTQAVRSLNERVSRLESANQDEAATEDAGPQSNDIDAVQQSSATVKEEALKRLEEIDSAYRSENRDQTWAPEMETKLDEAFRAGTYQGTKTVSSGCKATFCRMEVQHESAESALAFESIRRQIRGNFYMQHLDADQQGNSRTVVYFVRPGHETENALYDIMYTVK